MCCSHSLTGINTYRFQWDTASSLDIDADLMDERANELLESMATRLRVVVAFVSFLSVHTSLGPVGGGGHVLLCSWFRSSAAVQLHIKFRAKWY
jgi:hypothetical protein